MTAKESRPRHGNRRATQKSVSATTKDLLHLNPDARIESPSAEERREAELLAELLASGYRLAIRCRECNSWLVAHKSVREHVGPVCKSRLTRDDRR